MAIIHIRDVSEETLATLKVRAADAHQSLQAYVRTLLDHEASALSRGEFVAETRLIAARSSVSGDDVLDAIAQAREARV